MSPHELMETLLANKAAPVSDAIFPLVRDAQHFDAGSLDEIPVGRVIDATVRPPFPLTTVVIETNPGRRLLMGCHELPGNDRWFLFSARKVEKGAAYDAFWFFPSSNEVAFQKDTEGAKEHANGVVNLLLLFFSVLACSNVRAVDVPAPEALNKKRARSGKLPIKSHKVLHLVLPSSHNNRDALGGSHRSPRVHLRRGHIRRLENGLTVWVSACVVGSKHGIVTKDYAVSYSGSPA
jgi:hypothetical protein